MRMEKKILINFLQELGQVPLGISVALRKWLTTFNNILGIYMRNTQTHNKIKINNASLFRYATYFHIQPTYSYI